VKKEQIKNISKKVQKNIKTYTKVSLGTDCKSAPAGIIMKRIFFFVLLSIFFVPCIFAQEKNPTLPNTWTLRSGNLLLMERWSNEIRVSDITYDNLKAMEKNIEVLQKTVRDAERTIKNQEKIIRDQQRTIDNLQRTLNNLEREINNLKRR